MRKHYFIHVKMINWNINCICNGGKNVMEITSWQDQMLLDAIFMAQQATFNGVSYLRNESKPNQF